MININEILEKLNNTYKEIDQIALVNTNKVLNAFKESRVGLEHMAGSTGYGYSDISKPKLAEVFAKSLGGEKAIVSPLLTSGTHTLSSALMGLVKSEDNVLSITGEVYDSLQSTIYGENVGSFKDYNVHFNKIDLVGNDFNFSKIEAELKSKNYKICYIQHSAGYSTRETLSIEKIEEVIKFVKAIKKDIIVFVDNCYGTFSYSKEPCEVGADIAVGSLIKNAGGGIAPTGGYIVGKEKLINQIENRVYGIGLGSEVGSYEFGYRTFFEGFFIAPSVVAGCLKGSALIGACLEKIGVKTLPNAYAVPNDLIRKIEFNDKEKMIKFIQLVQTYCAVDSSFVPEPSDMPGYEDKVIMASGSFVQGSSIELSADGPIRPPYTVYFQGGINYYQVQLLAQNIDTI